MTTRILFRLYVLLPLFALGCAHTGTIATHAPVTEAAPLVTAGKFSRVYDPSVDMEKEWYINDHTFVRADDGTWHMFGITNTLPIISYNEDQLAHATSPSLTAAQWTKQPHALTTDASQEETHLWAPHVIRHDGTYFMFYCAGGTDQKSYGIHLATSNDLETWTRYEGNPLFKDGYEGRDPFVFRHNDQWIMYYTATSDPAFGNFVVAYRTSPDLLHWGERQLAFVDEKRGNVFGNTESPFVVRRGTHYYLFIGPRGGYAGTDVFVSETPFAWEAADTVGHLKAHATEIVRDATGQWYASHCGWSQGGLYLAPLHWNDGADDNDTSLPTP